MRLDVVRLLERLIAVDTRNPGGDEAALAEVIADLLATVQPDEVQVVRAPRGGDRRAEGASVWARFGPAPPRLLVNAHLDTVPADAGWTGDPLTARVSADRVVGLGAADIKGAIAAILAALGDARPRDVAILFSGDEEHGGACMRQFLASPLARGLERALVCEPTGCRAGTRHRGILALAARATGAGGHSSRADELPAPIAALARLGAALDDWGRLRRAEGPPGFRGLCLNLARLEGGVAFNVVPREATLEFSLRPPPGADVAALRRELEELAARRAPEVAVAAAIEQPAFATRDLEGFRPWLGALADDPIDLPYWTEAAMLAAAGIDAVVLGPGDVSQAHAADEHVSVADLHRARELFVTVFETSRRLSS